MAEKSNGVMVNLNNMSIHGDSDVDSPMGFAPFHPEADEQPYDKQLVSVDVDTRKFIVVVAIDFGTAYSGYAFSFTRDPSSIHIMRRWEGGDPGVVNQKSPTILLLDPNAKFHSFGYAARDYFHDLEPQEAKKWLYFDKFKMMLYDVSEINNETMIKALNGREIPAFKVFSYALKFFKEHVIEELNDQSSTAKITLQDVKWVLTVPAIWKESSKQFMRKAAYEAGMADSSSEDRLLIALEPEAASIYCRRLRKVELAANSKHNRLAPDPFSDVIADIPERLRPAASLDDGSRYVVLDCGGGTVDVTVHEMDADTGCLKELMKASGGPYGSVAVDLAFENLLKQIFTAEFIEQYKLKRPAGWVDLLTAFESRKRSASPNKEMNINVSIPFSFFDYYKRVKSHTVESAIKKFDSKDIKWSHEGMLRITPAGIRALFEPTITEIQKIIDKVLSTVGNLHFIFLVGGFAESPVLQQAVRNSNEPNGIQVIIPESTSLCVLKGAVYFGLDPNIIKIRRPKLTYGVGVLNKFVASKHDRKKLVVGKDGTEWVTDIFDPFVKTGQAISQGQIVTRSYTPAKSNQKVMEINVYASDNESVTYITDKGVRRCATMKVDLTGLSPIKASSTGSRRRRELQLTMQFGNTEVKVMAYDVTTGKLIKADIDFLS